MSPCRRTTESKVLVAQGFGKQAKAKMMMQTLTAQPQDHQQTCKQLGKQMVLEVKNTVIQQINLQRATVVLVNAMVHLTPVQSKTN